MGRKMTECSSVCHVTLDCDYVSIGMIRDLGWRYVSIGMIRDLGWRYESIDKIHDLGLRNESIYITYMTLD